MTSQRRILLVLTAVLSMAIAQDTFAGWTNPLSIAEINTGPTKNSFSITTGWSTCGSTYQTFYNADDSAAQRGIIKGSESFYDRL